MKKTIKAKKEPKKAATKKPKKKEKKKRKVGRPKKRGPKKKRYRNASNSKKFYIFNRYAASGSDIENEENVYPVEKIKLIEDNIQDGCETFNGYIYKYTFPNGKVYIGQTTKTVEERFQGHINCGGGQRPLRCDVAIKEYGPENVIVETLESLKCNNYDLLIEALDELETYYIKLYKSNFVEYGYNSTIGGRSQLSRYIKLDKETLKKVWEEIRNPNAKKRGRKELPPLTNVIISCKNGNQNKFIGQYRNEKEAYEAFKSLKKAEKKIVFPMSFTGSDKIAESVDEYVLLGLCNKNKKGYIRKNNEEVEVLDSFRYYREETFWVWGYNNKNERKTFMWILENIVLKDIRPKYVKNTYKNILTYKNKIIIKSTSGSTDIVFCKNETDAQKFYEMIDKYTKRGRRKLNSIILSGDFSKITKERKQLEQELIDITGFSRKRIQMKTNSYYVVD